jgi:hypothetical protein
MTPFSRWSRLGVRDIQCGCRRWDRKGRNLRNTVAVGYSHHKEGHQTGLRDGRIRRLWQGSLGSVEREVSAIAIGVVDMGFAVTTSHDLV